MIPTRVPDNRAAIFAGETAADQPASIKSSMGYSENRAIIVGSGNQISRQSLNTT
jgi:hypothetical protein